MKSYFTRENVIAVLTLSFGGGIFFGTKFNDTENKIISKYNVETENIRAENLLLKNSVEIMTFRNDSLTPVTPRVNDYFDLLEKIEKNDTTKLSYRIFNLRKTIMEDIANFSRFENVKTYGENNTYELDKKYLLSEQNLVNTLDEYYQSKNDKSKDLQDKLHKKVELAMLETYSYNKSSLSKTKYLYAKASENKKNTKEKEKAFDEEISRLDKLKNLYLFITFFCILFWITIFIWSLHFETFKKSSN